MGALIRLLKGPHFVFSHLSVPLNAGMASWFGFGEGQSAAAVPVFGPLEGPQPEGAVGHLAQLSAGDQPESAQS